MPRISRFEDIEAWQAGRRISQAAYQLTCSGDFARDFGLVDQIRRAAVSIMANIAEGFSRRSNQEFVQFLFIAKASAAELQSHLYVALDQRYIDQVSFQSLYDQADQCARQISGLISYLRRAQTQQTQQTQ